MAPPRLGNGPSDGPTQRLVSMAGREGTRSPCWGRCQLSLNPHPKLGPVPPSFQPLWPGFPLVSRNGVQSRAVTQCYVAICFQRLRARRHSGTSRITPVAGRPRLTTAPHTGHRHQQPHSAPAAQGQDRPWPRQHESRHLGRSSPCPSGKWPRTLLTDDRGPASLNQLALQTAKIAAPAIAQQGQTRKRPTAHQAGDQGGAGEDQDKDSNNSSQTANRRRSRRHQTRRRSPGGGEARRKRQPGSADQATLNQSVLTHTPKQTQQARATKATIGSLWLASSASALFCSALADQLADGTDQVKGMNARGPAREELEAPAAAWPPDKGGGAAVARLHRLVGVDQFPIPEVEEPVGP